MDVNLSRLKTWGLNWGVTSMPGTCSEQSHIVPWELPGDDATSKESNVTLEALREAATARTRTRFTHERGCPAV